MVAWFSPPAALLERVSRREVIALTGVVASVPVSGCADSVLSNDSGGEGDTIEIMVENRTDELATIGVRVEDAEGELLFSRVYELEPGHLDSSAGIETIPSTVTVFTPDGTSATWEYAPDLDIDCDGEDIGITLQGDDSIDSWYAC
ncbi:hypothetical protein [Natrinema salsiterrestre]|uniref:Uncharacterized protein n=1 Tax=Natrinema salsiterrestre TaxID=2950540 RepID=A0A9Q4Q1M1_9EURY|nr:hypothetical protein [Natrinema salsiterrestre]MDF9745651.1 hypothetical protein [Natrinema salsiterrestre]